VFSNKDAKLKENMQLSKRGNKSKEEIKNMNAKGRGFKPPQA
jgi:hypothetical protein